MNLTEWITKENLSIKEFAEEFANVVKENFGEHNYKYVTDIVNKHLANGVDTRNEPVLPIQNVSNSVCHECGSKNYNLGIAKKLYICEDCGHSKKANGC